MMKLERGVLTSEHEAHCLCDKFSEWSVTGNRGNHWNAITIRIGVLLLVLLQFL